MAVPKQRLKESGMSDKLIKYTLIILIVWVTYLLIQQRYTDEYQAGYAEGLRVALKTNPPSEELELVCAGLWVGQQNKKYWEKSK